MIAAVNERIRLKPFCDCHVSEKTKDAAMKSTIRLLVAFLCLSSSQPKARAVSPPPDGGYPGANTAEGENALFNLTSGLRNTGVGFETLFSNTTGGCNTASGFQALHDNIGGRLNTASGYQALFKNITGEFNTAIGSRALIVNTTGRSNTAIGNDALGDNTIGDSNTATGDDALRLNTTGVNNTANGSNALESNTSGSRNTASGFNALKSNTTGDSNVALGMNAGSNATTGDGNVYIGTGMDGVAGEANHTYIRNINRSAVNGGGTGTVRIYLATGLLGHETSSRRYKTNISPIGKASEAIFALKPVTYQYKKEIDPSQSPAFGLIAEQVAEVNPNLVAHNSEGQPETVQYEMVNAMLLNEFLKEHRKNEKQEARIAELTAEVATLFTTVKEQAAQIRKVNTFLEIGKRGSQLAENNQ